MPNVRSIFSFQEIATLDEELRKRSSRLNEVTTSLSAIERKERYSSVDMLVRDTDYMKLQIS